MKSTTQDYRKDILEHNNLQRRHPSITYALGERLLFQAPGSIIFDMGFHCLYHLTKICHDFFKLIFFSFFHITLTQDPIIKQDFVHEFYIFPRG